MRNKLILSLILSTAIISPAIAQTQLWPPNLQWGQQNLRPTPTQNVGYDSVTGNPCIVGSSATCSIPTSAGAPPAGGATSANQDTTNTYLGAPGSVACATDTSSCNLNQFLQRVAQRVSAVVTALGSPFQIGGTNNTVSPIAGQNGVSSNGGVMDAGTQRVVLASDGPTVTVLGSTTGAAVVTDANGTIQQYLRGLVKLIVGLAQGSTTSGQTGALVMGAATSAPPSYSNASTNPISTHLDGATRVAITAEASGGASFTNVAAGQATTIVKSGAGTLFAIVLNSAATATNTTIIYDNTAGSGTVIARPAVTTATVPTTLNYGAAGLAFATGLTIVTATANGGDMTVIYK